MGSSGMAFSEVGCREIGGHFIGNIYLRRARAKRAVEFRVTLRRDFVEVGDAKPREEDGGRGTYEFTDVYQNWIVWVKAQGLCQL